MGKALVHLDVGVDHLVQNCLVVSQNLLSMVHLGHRFPVAKWGGLGGHGTVSYDWRGRW